MRTLALLPATLLAGCLIQNPGFDVDAATSTTTAAVTTDEPGVTTGEPDSAGPGDTDTTSSTTTAAPATTGCTTELLFPDADNDGFGDGPAVLACPGDPGLADKAGDCNDADNAVYPGAPELCNQRDDDCNGLLDEFSASNIDCANCNLAAFGGHSYWFCRSTGNWDGARDICHGFGAVDLAIVDDQAENDFLFAGNALPDLPMWVGGRDSDPNTQAVYTWYDGSPLTFNNFALSDLDNGCIALPNGDAGKWRDRDCTFEYTYVCESID